MVKNGGWRWREEGGGGEEEDTGGRTWAKRDWTGQRPSHQLELAVGGLAGWLHCGRGGGGRTLLGR